MSLAVVEAQGIPQYVSDAIDYLIKSRSPETANNPLRKDRVNERLFEQVIEKFGKQTKYDRTVIRKVIDAQRLAVNAARADRGGPDPRSPANMPYDPAPGIGDDDPGYEPPTYGPPDYQADVIVVINNPDGTQSRGRFTIQDLFVGDREEVLDRLTTNQAYLDMIASGQISWGKHARPGQGAEVGDVHIKSKRIM